MKGACITRLSVRVAARDNGSNYTYCGHTSYMNKVNGSSTDPIKHGLTILLYCILSTVPKGYRRCTNTWAKSNKQQIQKMTPFPYCTLVYPTRHELY